MDEEKIGKLIREYEDYAKKNGFKLNPNKNIVEQIIKGLLLKEGKFGFRYCPCRKIGKNQEENKKIVCPCVFHKEEIEKYGHCHCMLFVKL